jgi:DNA-binding NarL/FixJ family response regulator
VTPVQRAENIRTPSAGKLPSADLASMSADASASDLREATDEVHSKPQTIGKIHSRKVRIALAIIDERAFTRGSIARSLKKLCNPLTITSFATCDECLASTEHYDLVLLHMRESIATQASNVRKVLPIAPVIILSDDDSYDSVHAAFDIGVRGYIPTVSTPPELAIEIMYLVDSGGTFFPPIGLSPRGISLRGPLNRVTTQQFTPRQMAVLHRLKLGKTNKIIAYELQISESSVKSHIRNIMNKMNAKNRTEVACRAQELQC